MTRPIIAIAKKAVGVLPATWPSKIYNTALRIPLLKGPMSAVISRIAPDHIDMPEGTVVFDKSDPAMSGSIGLGKYEQGTVGLFRTLITPGMCVVDIGANLGYYTVIAAGRVGPTGRVFAYEPDPHNFELLNKNIKLNSFAQVRTFPVALADTAGTRELFFADNQCTLSFGDKKGAGRSETVTTETLDSSLAVAGSPRVDFIKMDIEGAEPIAFAGMEQTIARNPHITILFEYYPNAIARVGHDPLAFLERFATLGFKLEIVDEDKATRTPISDIAAYHRGFRGRERSQNIIATRG